MKITKLLAIGMVAFAAHNAQAQWSNIDVEKLNDINMEMPLASDQKTFSYEDVNTQKMQALAKPITMPLASFKEDFSYDSNQNIPLSSKEETSNKISNILDNMRNNSNTSTNKFKY